MRYIWTAGRKCNFKGCEHFRHLQPVIENGWFWQIKPKNVKIPNPFTNECSFCEWSHTGYFKKRQPDNRQGKLNGKDEGCLAILNNLYKDGLKWHDVACYHKKAIICQRKAA